MSETTDTNQPTNENNMPTFTALDLVSFYQNLWKAEAESNHQLAAFWQTFINLAANQN